MDQPTKGNHRQASSLTPVGTAQLEKFRVGQSADVVPAPSERPNQTEGKVFLSGALGEFSLLIA